MRATLGGLDAFDSPGVAVPFVMCFCLALGVEAYLTDVTGDDRPLGFDQWDSERVVDHGLLHRIHRVEVMEEAHAVRRWGRLHGELEKGLHVQVRLDHGGGPQERGYGRPRPVYSS